MRMGILVFDGANLDAKGSTEEENQHRRIIQIERAKEAQEKGDEDKVRKYSSKAVDVTPLMAGKLIKYLNIHFPIVIYIDALYESDA